MINVNASSLARVMECAGSLFFKDLPPEPNSEAAKEGTAAGEYLEHLLMGSTPGTHAKNGVPFDDDMIYYATGVAEDIRSKAEGEIKCEVKVDWQGPSNGWVRGRYDASFVSEGKLYVDDYKYGWGLVEVKNNWQLLAYGIGEVIRRNESFNSIVLRIHQPRPHHEDGPTREWEISYDTLLEFKNKIEERFHEIGQGEKGLSSSTNCKYCKASVVCPAFNKAYHRGVEVVQDFIQDTMDNEELSFQLDLVSRIEELVKMRKDSLTHLTSHRIKQGEIVPNYILRESYGHRKWSPNATPKFFEAMGIDAVEKKLISPAKVEKLGVPKELVNQLTSKPFLGDTVKRQDTSKMGDKIFGKPKNG